MGGGPTGSTAALLLARAGIDVLLIEKAAFPRFQIGESFLPYNLELIQELGLEASLKRKPHIRKIGAEFGMGGGLDTTLYRFDIALSGKATNAFNIARADFDDMLLTEAIAAGARVMQPMTVRQINHLRDGDVSVTLGDGQVAQAKYLIDATGQATLLGKRMKWRTTLEDSHLRKVAYFSHFTHVKRLQGENEGMPTIAMCKEGWFWIIPLNDTVTSVGMVLEPQIARQIDLPADQMLKWGIERCPLVRDRMLQASIVESNHVRADFSYRCPPFADEGFFLAGDAAMFLDPVFSTGVCIGMSQGQAAAKQVINILQKNQSPRIARKEYSRFVQSSTYWFRRLIGYYYRQPFRELFLQGQGPLQVHCAVITVLAGHVFPRPEWKVYWRFKYFELLELIQRYHPLAPRRPIHSLVDAQPEPLG